MRALRSHSHIAVATLALLFALATPFGSVVAAQDDDPIDVVVSFSVLADIVEQVGGDHVNVTSLVPVGGDAHTFDPAPDQVAAIADADLIVEAGGGYEPWLDDLVEASGTDAPRYEAFGSGINHDPDDHEGDEHQSDEDASHDDDEDAHDGEDHDHEGELHVWLDVENAIHTVVHLAEALAAVDPDNADTYTSNAEAYAAELEELDAYIAEQTATLPEERRQLITTHQSFGAFADAYDYEIAGVLLESHSTEGADAPAGHVAELIGIIEERDIPAVFPDTPGGGDLLEPLANETGAEIAPNLYVETLGEDGGGVETYVDMMRHNIDTIVTALGE